MKVAVFTTLTNRSFAPLNTLFVLLFCACSVLAPAAHAQEAAGAPALRRGDQWTTRRVDLWTGREVQRIQTEVISRAEGETTILRTERTVAGQVVSVERSTLAVGTLRFDNHDPKLGHSTLDLDFPLSVGKTWTTEFKTASPNPNYQIPHTRTARVEAWESVSTPAGTFQAVRIEYVDRAMWFIADGIFPAYLNTTVWYSPAVKWYVKRHEVLRNPLKKIETQTLEELIESKSTNTN